MTKAQTGPAAGSGLKPSFHLWMTLLMAFFVFGGFGMTYIGPLASGTFPPAPPVVHLHGAFYFGWMVFLVAQSLLVNVNNVRLHRSFGTFGIALAGCLVFVGLLITILGASAGLNAPDDAGLFYLSLLAPVCFAVIFGMAIRAVKRPQVHRNLILIATISVLMPGINRLYMMGLGLDRVPFYGTYLTMNLMLAALLVHERKATGSVSRMTWIATAIVVVPQLFLSLVAPTQWFVDLVNYLGSLAYYR